MSAEDVCHSTIDAHLSDPDQEGNTDIDEGPAEESGPTFIRHKDKSIPPRDLLFTAATNRTMVTIISPSSLQTNKWSGS